MKKIKKGEVFEGTFGKLQLVEDFLPPPENLIIVARPSKVTLNLDSEIVDFFKTQAKKLGGSYQRMIRNLLKAYVEQQYLRQAKLE